MPRDEPVAVFRSPGKGQDGVGFVLVEFTLLEVAEGVIRPRCVLTARQARRMAHALTDIANQIDS